jgi:hypothetical protein
MESSRIGILCFGNPGIQFEQGKSEMSVLGLPIKSAACKITNNATPDELYSRVKSNHVVLLEYKYVSACIVGYQYSI